MKKKLAAFACAAAMVFGTAGYLPQNVVVKQGGITASAETYGDFGYRVIDEDSIEITKYEGTDTEVIIPDTIDGKPVTNIGYQAFYNCTNLTCITIPDSVTSIGKHAFSYCTNLTSVTIPYSVTSVDYYTFSNCESLTSITLPNSVTSIGICAFCNCSSLTSITIPDSVSSIGEYAFSNCTRLTNITIPNSVTSIAESAFSYCTRLTRITIPASVTELGDGALSNCANLTSINVDENNPTFCSVNDVVFDKDKKVLKQYPAGKENESYSIPDSVTSIGNSAFGYCQNLTSVLIPDSVTSIGDRAFSRCTSLTSITIPDSVTSIGYLALSNCTNLTSIIIPNSVTSIGHTAFYGCTNLTNITIPDSVTSIGPKTFYDCRSLTDVYYNGKKAQWEALDIDSGNEELLNAKIHYLASLKVTPEFIWQKGDRSVKLTWEAVPGAEKYGIAGLINGKWQLLDKTTATSYTLKNLTAGTNYNVAVIAMFDGEWYQDYSKAVTVTPNAETVDLYPVVQTQVKDSKIGFKWSKVPYAEKYGIGVYQANKWVVKKQLDGSITTWTSPQVRNGTYRLVVLAKVNGQWVNADVFKKAFYVTVP